MKTKDKAQRLVVEALSTTNPFMLRTETGMLRVYPSAKDAYEAVMSCLLKDFPFGFIDVPFFMMKYQRLSPVEARHYCRGRQYAFVYDWRDDTDRETLRRVYGTLLRVSGCDFDDSSFQHALTYLDSLLESREVKVLPPNPFKLLNVIL